MVSDLWYTVLVGLVALERLAELVVAKRNLAWKPRTRRARDGILELPFQRGG